MPGRNVSGKVTTVKRLRGKAPPQGALARSGAFREKASGRFNESVILQGKRTKQSIYNEEFDPGSG